jgi:PHD-finger
MTDLQRVEPFGWDSDDRTYFVLDDNRLYRQTEPPPPPAPAPAPKKNSKKAKAALRASKRRKVSEPAISEDEIINNHAGDKESSQAEDDGLGGVKWECIAVTLDDLNSFLASIERSRDPNEKVLRKRIIDDLLPLLERQEEARKRKAAQKEKELINLEKLATAKRSSRIAGKLEQQRQEEEARETERKRQAELAMAKREREKWMKLERERESRMVTREQRLREREARRILHEEELANLSEDSKKLESGQSRLSERHLKAEIERKKQVLEELAEEEDDWVFDCICGAYGQVDDGTHSISCEKCNIWQHTKCVGVSEVEADGDDFHFICKSCKRRTEETQKAKHRPTIKLKLNRPSSSSAATPHETNGSPSRTPSQLANGSSGLSISPHKSNPFYQASLPKSTYDSPYGKGGFGSIQVQIPSVNYSSTATPSQAKEKPSNLSWPHMNGSSPAHPFPSPTSHINGQSASPVLNHRILPVPRPTNQQSQQINGYTSQSISGSHSTAMDSHINTPAASKSHPHPSLQSTSSGRYSTLPSPAQGMQNRVRADQLRQSSTSMPSPLTGAPILTPYADKSPIFASSLSPNLQSTPTQQRSQMTAVQRSSSPMNLPKVQSPNLDAAHEYALPPAISGISPTKHSPPQPTIANGVTSLGIATPSLLPPVAPLSPSPQQPDPTSPVKPATPRGIS